MGAWIPALVSEYLKMSMDVFVFPRLRAQGLLRMYVLFGLSWASLVAQLIKNLPTVRETWV